MRQNGLALRNVDPVRDPIDKLEYFKLCLEAVYENGNALNYVEPGAGKLDGKEYMNICSTAITKDLCAIKFVLEKFTTPTFFKSLCRRVWDINPDILLYYQYTLVRPKEELLPQGTLCMISFQPIEDAVEYVKCTNTRGEKHIFIKDVFYMWMRTKGGNVYDSETCLCVFCYAKMDLDVFVNYISLSELV